MKEVTVFAEKSIEIVDESQRDFRFNNYEPEFRCYGDEPVVRTKKKTYKIHYFRKLAVLSPLEVIRSEGRIESDLKAKGFVECSMGDPNSKEYIKEKRFIVMDEDLNEVITTSLEKRKQDEDSLNLEALQEQNDRLNQLAGKYFEQATEYRDILTDTIWLLGKLEKQPWYKRLFGWRKSINTDRELIIKRTYKVKNEN